MSDYIVLLSLVNIGFVGGFTHCVGMCGPFVLMQTASRLQNTSVEHYSTLQKLRGFALLPYHFGRIVTYSFIGFISSFIADNLQESVYFKHLSGILLIFAAIFFLHNFFGNKFNNGTSQKQQDFVGTHPKSLSAMIVNNIFLKFPLHQLSNLNFWKIFGKFFSVCKKFLLGHLKNLFKNPQGFNGFLLGLILGFIPCGLLYGAFALAASIANPSLAALAMLLFGVATFPALFVTACGGYSFLKFTNKFKLILQILVLINAITLLIMGVGLVIR